MDCPAWLGNADRRPEHHLAQDLAGVRGGQAGADVLTSPQRLDRAFLSRPAREVAPQLLGCLISRPAEGTVARIVEVEAYEETEPASHTFGGRTPRNDVMFGRAGHLYTYFVYGMHWCANVVTGAAGEGQAVLLRAAEPLEGEEELRRRRPPATSSRDLLRGPARLASAFGLDGQAGGLDLLAPGSWLHLCRPSQPLSDAAVPLSDAAVAQGPRVGVRHAADLPWRFWIEGSPHVSDYRRHPKASVVDQTVQEG